MVRLIDLDKLVQNSFLTSGDVIRDTTSDLEGIQNHLSLLAGVVIDDRIALNPRLSS